MHTSSDTEVNLKNTLTGAFSNQHDPFEGGFFAAGEVLGAFVIEKTLGSGAMGRVYKVRQRDPVVREVALKILRTAVDQDDAAKRAHELLFEMEKRALASLNHPNIAKLYDAGILPTKPPLFYLAMEWVDGVTLDAYASTLKQHSNAVSKITNLFVDICLGAQHAHRKHLVHRDIKPSNILVQEIDGKSVPKIIDFGVAIGARANASQVAGTREYMAPEQRALSQQVDARADVHAIGVSLAEVLCIALDADLGRTLNSDSLRSALSPTPESLQDLHSEIELPPIGRIPAPLRAIIAKAISSNPDLRYASTGDFARDLQAFASNHVVSAMPQSRSYVWQLFVKRNKLAIALSAIAAFSLLLGSVSALYGLKQARVERTLALKQAERAQETSDFLKAVLSSVDPDEARNLDTKLLKKVLQRAADQVKTRLPEQPLVQAEVMEIVAKSYNAISEYKLATSVADEALTLLAKVEDADPRSILSIEMLKAQGQSGEGDNKTARTNLERVCSQAGTQFGANDLDVLRCQSQLAWEQLFVGDIAAAVKNAQSTQAQLQKIDAPIGPLTYNLRVLGAALGDSGDFKAAEAAQRQLLDVSLQHYGAEHTRTHSAKNSLGVALLQQKRYTEAAELYAELLPVTEKLFGPEHQATISVVSNYAGALRQSGQLAKSAPYYQRAYDATVKSSGASSRNTLLMEINMANFETANQQALLALARLARTEAKLSAQFDASHPVFPELWRTRAKAQVSLQKNALATQSWQQVLDWCATHDQSPDQACSKEAQEALSVLW